jgi:hypothetical protein
MRPPFPPAGPTDARRRNANLPSHLARFRRRIRQRPNIGQERNIPSLTVIRRAAN